MLIRVSGQLFALPMQSVYGIGDGQQSHQTPQRSGAHSSNAYDAPPVPLRELLGFDGPEISHPQVLTLTDNPSRRREHSEGENQKAVARQLSIVVDAVVGVEEVVVRSLPSLLHGHELFSGVTLSGDAETVLIFDVPRLIDCGLNQERRNLHLEQQLIRREAAVQRRLSRGTPRAANGQRFRCLVVDDSLTARRQLVRKLAQHGVESVEAPDGIEALDMLRNGEFHGVVTDLDMPRMNGVDLYDEIRRRAPHKNLPVAILTSRTAADTIQIIPDAKLVFVKPATDEAVAEIVAEINKAQQT
jgi:CheY-like chemotaxis protein